MHRHDYAGKRVLVTGGLGFIGSSLAIELVESGAEVTVVDSMIPAYGANLFNVEPVRERLHINFSDIRDRYSLEHLVREKDHIFNLAGQLSHIDSMRDPMTDLEINCAAQLSLLECLRCVNPEVKTVFGSTRQIYGRPQYLPVDEDHPIRPVDVNGINKWASESFFRLYHEVHGIASVSVRLTNTYGPRMDLRSDTKGFVGIFVRRALQGEHIDVFGTGDQKRDFNYVDDVVEALLRAGQTEEVYGRALNLGHPHPYSLNELLEILAGLADFPHTHKEWPKDRKKIDVGDYYGDDSQFRDATGWEPTVDLAEGLEKTLDFYRRHGSHYGWNEGSQ